MRRLCLFCVVLVCVLTPAAAQDNQAGYPLPKLAVITPENASQLGEKASIGGSLAGEMAWSPDGKTLAVGTTDGVRAFDATNWDLPPRDLPGWKDVRFDAKGSLISDGKVIDPASGNVISDTLSLSPSGKSRIDYRDVGGHAAVVLTDVASGTETILDTNLPGTIQYVVFSPDEQFAALKMHTEIDDTLNAAQLWNIQTGTLIENLQLEQSYDDPIETFGFHMQGKLLVMSSAAYGEDGSTITVQIWDGRTGKKLSHPHTGNVPVRFSLDDNLLAFPGGQGMYLWSNHEIGLLEGEYMIPAFSPDGRRLAGYSVPSSTINIWNIDTALKLGEPDKTFTGKIIDSVTFSPDGNLLAANEYDSRVRIWNLDTNNVEVVLSNITGELQFSPDGQWILAKRADTSRFALWDAHTGERMMDFEEKFAINPDWTLAAQGTAQIVTLPDGQAIRSLRVLDTYMGAVQRFDADESRILFLRQVFDTLHGKEVSGINYYSPIPLTRDAFSTGWTRMLVTDDPSTSDNVAQHTALVLQLEADQKVNSTYFWGESLPEPTTAFLSKDGTTIGYITRPVTYGAFRTSRLELRAIETGKSLKEWQLPGDIQAMTISHDGKWLALGSTQDYDGYLIFLNLEGDLATKSPIIRAINYPSLGSSIRVASITFSADDQHIALDGYTGWCGDGGCIHPYFMKTWNVPLLLADERLGEQFSMKVNGVHAPIFSPDGSLVLTTTVEGWNSDLNPGAMQLWSEVGHKKVVELSGDDGIAAFSPNGRILAVHQGDRTLVYDTDELKKGSVRPLVTCPDRDKPVTEVAFSPDGKILYVVSENRVRLFGVGS